MKASILQLVSSSVVLGLMAGAVGLHWHGVSKVAEQPASKPETGLFAKILPEEGPVPVSSLSGVAEGQQETRAGQAPGSAEMGATVEALNEIVSVLRELKDENQHLREQVKEANRDLTEMRFQIDTHSKSFRPLKVSEPAAPLRSEVSHPLLPPKRRN